MGKIILMEIWRALWNWILKRPKPVSIVPSLPTDPVTGALDVLAVAGQLGISAVQVLDSPEFIAARYNVETQKVKDAIQLHNQQAMKTGNGDDVNKELTP